MNFMNKKLILKLIPSKEEISDTKYHQYKIDHNNEQKNKFKNMATHLQPENHIALYFEASIK